MLIRVGPKGRHMVIPDGWEIITNVPMQPGDLCANIYTARWEGIDDEDVGMFPWQECVIRRMK